MNRNRYGNKNRVSKSENAGYFKNQQKSNKLEMEGKLSRPDRTMRRKAARNLKYKKYSIRFILENYDDIRYFKTLVSFLEKKMKNNLSMKGINNLSFDSLEFSSNEYLDLYRNHLSTLDSIEAVKNIAQAEVRCCAIFTSKTVVIYFQRRVCLVIENHNAERDKHYITRDSKNEIQMNNDYDDQLLLPENCDNDIKEQIKFFLSRLNKEIKKPTFK